MLVHDIAIDHLHAVFCVDRAGLVGDDGETHHGLFDPGFLQTIPGITVLSPASLGELSDMLNQAVHHCNGPVAVRYPRGGETQYHENHSGPAACVLREGEDLSWSLLAPSQGTCWPWQTASSETALGQRSLSSIRSSLYPPRRCCTLSKKLAAFWWPRSASPWVAREKAFWPPWQPRG